MFRPRHGFICKSFANGLCMAKFLESFRIGQYKYKFILMRNFGSILQFIQQCITEETKELLKNYRNLQIVSINVIMFLESIHRNFKPIGLIRTYISIIKLTFKGKSIMYLLNERMNKQHKQTNKPTNQQTNQTDDEIVLVIIIKVMSLYQWYTQRS